MKTIYLAVKIMEKMVNWLSKTPEPYDELTPAECEQYKKLNELCTAYTILRNRRELN